MEKLTKIIDMIEALTEENFTEYVKITFAGGTLSRGERVVEILET
ncbi:MAG: hypothetical protein ABR903_07675 [Thermodesulfovibrionales bacterium]|jgi:hypothetical protein